MHIYNRTNGMPAEVFLESCCLFSSLFGWMEAAG